MPFTAPGWAGVRTHKMAVKLQSSKRWRDGSLARQAAEQGNIKLLAWMLRNGSSLRGTCSTAALHRDQRTLEWLVAHGARLSASTAEAAALVHNLDMLKCARCPLPALRGLTAVA